MRMTEIRNLDVALVQVHADTDAGVNRERLAGALAKLAPVDFILLPEVFALRGNHADFQRAASITILSDPSGSMSRLPSGWPATCRRSKPSNAPDSSSCIEVA